MTSSFRQTSLLNILPQGDEEQLRAQLRDVLEAQHQDVLKNISMMQTMVRMYNVTAVTVRQKLWT
jgi:hypothetical protein